jgi:hypothetical protein
MTDKETMKLALDALDIAQGLLADARSYHQPKMLAAYTAIKQALAQPEQEPVAWAHYDTFKNLGSLTRARFTATLATKKTDACCIALYTHPINQKD